MCSKFWFERLRGRDHSEDLGIDGKMIKWPSEEQGWSVWIGFIWFRFSCHHALQG
jgi:hypothetical protein